MFWSCPDIHELWETVLHEIGSIIKSEVPRNTTLCFLGDAASLREADKERAPWIKNSC